MRRHLGASVWALAALAPGGAAWAADGVASVGEVTVTGARLPTPISNIPGSVQVIDRSEIDAQTSVNRYLQDALPRIVPGLNLGRPNEGGDGTGGGPALRGRPAMVLIDGVPVNTLTRFSGGDSLALINPNAIQRIEVVRGANATYGFGAAGGIINIQTWRGQDGPPQVTSDFQVGFQPSDVGSSLSAATYHRVGGGTGPFDYSLGLGYERQGSLFGPEGERFAGATTFNAYNLDLSLGYDLGEYGRFRLTANSHYRDVMGMWQATGGIKRQQLGRAGRLVQSEDTYRRNSVVNLAYDVEALGSEVSVNLFHQKYHFVVYGFTSGRYRDQRDQRLGLRTSVRTPLNGLQPGASVSYGFDYLHNRAYEPELAIATEAVVRVFQPRVRQASYAGFVQLDLPLGPQWRLSGGVRHEEIHQSAKSGLNQAGQPFVGGDVPSFGLTLFNLGFVYNLDAENEVFAGFSQGAQITELGRGAALSSGVAFFRPQPAKADQYEIGVRGRQGRLSYEAAAFHSRSKLGTGFLVVPDSINIPIREPRQVTGVELAVDYQITSQWAVGGNVAYQRGIRQLPNGDWRIQSPRDVTDLLVNAHVEWRPVERASLRLQALGWSGRSGYKSSSAFGEGSVKPEVILDLLGAYYTGRGVLRAGVQNLLNTHYVSRIGQGDNTDTAWYEQPGTRVLIGYSIGW